MPCIILWFLYCCVIINLSNFDSLLSFPFKLMITKWLIDVGWCWWWWRSKWIGKQKGIFILHQSKLSLLICWMVNHMLLLCNESMASIWVMDRKEISLLKMEAANPFRLLLYFYKLHMMIRYSVPSIQQRQSESGRSTLYYNMPGWSEDNLLFLVGRARER